MSGSAATLTAFTRAVAAFVRERKPDGDAVSLDDATELIDSRIVDSLLFVEFLLFLEDYFGCEIVVQSSDIDTFRTTGSIFHSFHARQGVVHV